MGTYRFHKWAGSKGPKTRWICAKARCGCKASITTLEDKILRANNEHNH